MNQFTQEHKDRMLKLWRISRTALSDRVPSRFDRLQYVSRHFDAEFPGFSHKQIWMEADYLTRSSHEVR